MGRHRHQRGHPRRRGRAGRDGSPYQLRTVEEITGWFAGLELVDPGVVPVTQWRPDPAEVGGIEPVDGYGGIAREP